MHPKVESLTGLVQFSACFLIFSPLAESKPRLGEAKPKARGGKGESKPRLGETKPKARGGGGEGR